MSEDYADCLHHSDEGTGARPLLARLYREIGVAAIAAELGLDLDDAAESVASVVHNLGGELAA